HSLVLFYPTRRSSDLCTIIVELNRNRSAFLPTSDIACRRRPEECGFPAQIGGRSLCSTIFIFGSLHGKKGCLSSAAGIFCPLFRSEEHTSELQSPDQV